MTPLDVRKALLVCALVASPTLTTLQAFAQDAVSPLPQAGGRNRPVAPRFPEAMKRAIETAEDFDVTMAPPPPPEDEQFPAPPPAKKGKLDDAEEQDVEGPEEKGVPVSDRTLCPNPQILGNQMVIHHFYVGQGDATFIRTPTVPGSVNAARGFPKGVPGISILIDGGEMGHQEEIMATLDRCYGLKSVDYLVLSHPHSDHFGGLLELLKHTPEGIKVLETGKTPDFAINNGIFVTGFKPQPIPGGNKDDKGLGVKLQSFLKIANVINKARGIKDTFLPFGKGNFLSRNGAREIAKFNVLARNGEVANGDKVDDLFTSKGELREGNATSSAIHVGFGTFDYFTSGDMTAGKASEPDVEGLLAKSGLLKKMDVVKSSHHGSDTSNSQVLLDAADPLMYLVSVGDAGQNRNSFHLPRIARVLGMHAQVSKVRQRFGRQTGFVMMTSCGAGNVMPIHPFCNALFPFHEAAEREKQKAGRKITFNYRVGLDDDDKQIPGGLRQDLANFMNSQGDIVITVDPTQARDGKQNYFVLVPHHPRPPRAPRLIKTGDDSMPISMAPEAPTALGPFQTDGLASFDK